MNKIMRCKASDVQMSSYLIALSMKKEIIGEITASAASLRNYCIKILPDMDVLELSVLGRGRCFLIHLTFQQFWQL